MEPHEPDYARALREAERFLRRWGDGFTSRVCEDVAQEAVIASWQRRATLRDAERFHVYVRTVARRIRYQLLRRERARPVLSLDAELQLSVLLEAREPSREPVFTIAGEPVDRAWLVGRLRSVLARFSTLNRRLLRGYYAGASARELAERHDLTVARVKARLHRGRRRVRQEFTERVRRARDQDSGTADGRARPFVSEDGCKGE